MIYSCRLRDGRSIRTVSALLLQLVQTSAHDVRTAVRKISKRRQQTLARKDSWVDASEKRTFLDDNDLDVCLYLISSTVVDNLRSPGSRLVLFGTRIRYEGRENYCCFPHSKVLYHIVLYFQAEQLVNTFDLSDPEKAKPRRIPMKLNTVPFLTT